MGSDLGVAESGTLKKGTNLWLEFSCKPRCVEQVASGLLFMGAPLFRCIFFLESNSIIIVVIIITTFFCNENLLHRSFLSLSDVIFLLPFMMPTRVIETLWLSLPCRRCFLRLSP